MNYAAVSIRLYHLILLATLCLMAFPLFSCETSQWRNDRADIGASTSSVTAEIRDVSVSDSIVIAFYNVENLFDTEDDPRIDDEEFTSGGRAGWSAERLEKKMEKIARAIHAINGGSGPDVIGLSEVENRAVLERLVDEHLGSDRWGIVHYESPDARGIDVALLYRSDKMSLAGSRSHSVPVPQGRATRDIIEATFARGGASFTVFANHWPSRRGGESESEPRRMAAARTLAGAIDAIRDRQEQADIVAIGDFNDEPFNRSITEVLGAHPYRGDGAFSGRMINTAAPVAEIDTIGSYYYRHDWETIDQILVSPGLLDTQGLVLLNTSQSVFTPEFLRDSRADARVRPPYRTYKGPSYYIGGTSDHFPVYLVIGFVSGG